MPPAAGHQPTFGRGRQVSARRRNRRRAEGGERRRPIGRGKPAERRGIEGITVERFGRRPLEIGVGEQAGKRRLVERACARQRPILVDRPAQVALGPVVEQRIARTGVERQDFVLFRPDPGQVAHPAEVEHGERFLQIRGEGGVIERRERRALPALGHVPAAKVADHVQTRLGGEQRAVAQLARQARFGRVQDGLAVESGNGDLARGHPRLFEKRLDRGRVAQRELALDCLHRAAFAQGAAQARAEGRIVGQAERRARLDEPRTVAADKGGVDTVKRGAAHQAERPAAGMIGHESRLVRTGRL